MEPATPVVDLRLSEPVEAQLHPKAILKQLVRTARAERLDSASVRVMVVVVRMAVVLVETASVQGRRTVALERLRAAAEAVLAHPAMAEAGPVDPAPLDG